VRSHHHFLSLLSGQLLRPAAPTFRNLVRNLGALLASVVWCGAGAAQEYELGPQDRVRVAVVEWVLEELRSPINGEFTVGSSGLISLPLIGDVSARGTTLSGLAASISEKLKAKLELSEEPKTSIEIVAFRPFYILGDVERPGEYAYRPAMTVLQAISLAGGFWRSEAGSLQLKREADALRGEMKAALHAVDEHRAREARLEAEIENRPSVLFPEDLRGRQKEPAIAELLHGETLLFEARRRGLASEIQSGNRLITLFDEEASSLERYSSALAEQRETTSRQLKLFLSLKERGLASPGRELDLERALADVQSKLREAGAQTVRNAQERARAEAAVARSLEQRQMEAITQLRETKTASETLRQRNDRARAAISTIETVYPDQGRQDYAIVRPDSPAGSHAAVDEGTPIRPGDVLQVTVRQHHPELLENAVGGNAQLPAEPGTGLVAVEDEAAEP
jgi:protein involved in polysaccharide export with SLBB domain